KSQECVHADNMKQKCVQGFVSCHVPMTVTVPKMRNAAAMDVDVSVWLQL
ncbi:hypothetical protein ABG768_015896, partial [Culter alburnus]